MGTCKPLSTSPLPTSARAEAIIMGKLPQMIYDMRNFRILFAFSDTKLSGAPSTTCPGHPESMQIPFPRETGAFGETNIGIRTLPWYVEYAGPSTFLFCFLTVTSSLANHFGPCLRYPIICRPGKFKSPPSMSGHKPSRRTQSCSSLVKSNDRRSPKTGNQRSFFSRGSAP